MSEGPRETPASPEQASGFSYIDDPIVALASGASAAAIAVLRFSGRGCHELIAPCLSPRAEKREPRLMQLTRLIDPESNETIDEPMVVFFFGPKSFTGEDSGELYLHGGPYIIQTALALLYRIGFRAANPGEFTQRAFLRGKLDLTAAEGIQELVSAQAKQQWLAARQLATGKLASSIEQLRLQLIESLAYLEARIDFPEEGDTQDVGLAQVNERALKVQKTIAALLASYQSGRVASQGLKVAIIGAPNAGKSTLMNTLLGHERAIVTSVAGTTRDYIDEPCLIDGRLFRLIDTAGVRDTVDEVEKIGVESAKHLAETSDLILHLVPANAEHSSHDAWLQMLPTEKTIQVTTKVDLCKSKPVGLAVSCHSGEGLDELRSFLVSKIDSHLQIVDQEQAYLTSARHFHTLQAANKSLDEFFRAYEDGAYDECLGFELQTCVRQLASIIGQVDSDDILEQIFSKFCIGK